MGLIIAIGGEWFGGARHALAARCAAACAQSGPATVFVDASLSGPVLCEQVFGGSGWRSISETVRASAAAEPSILRGYLRNFRSLSVIAGDDPSRAPVSPDDLIRLLTILGSVYARVIVNAPAAGTRLADALAGRFDWIVPVIGSDPAALADYQHVRGWWNARHRSAKAMRPLVCVMGRVASDDEKRTGGIITETLQTIAVSGNDLAGLTGPISSDPSTLSAALATVARALTDLRARPDALETATDPAGPGDALSRDCAERIHREVVKLLEGRKGADTDLRAAARPVIEQIIAKDGRGLSQDQRARLAADVLNEVAGLGPLEEFLMDETVTEIMVNGPDMIYIERAGRIHLTDRRFSSVDRLRTAIDRIVAPLGRRIDESSPVVDARLADGSRVNAVIPPVAIDGPALTIRKFTMNRLSADDLVARGALSPEMALFLAGCVRARKNIIVSGGTGTGKTTLLNILAACIPSDERIVTIEDSAELRLPQEHVVRLESRPASVEGTGAVLIRSLVVNALRMRPDRIVVGECRAGEALDMLQAMNTGHDGSLTTVHANTARDAIARVITMSLMAGMDLPERAIREQIISAVRVIVQLQRFPDGTRRVVEVSELGPDRDGPITVIPLYLYDRAAGTFLATGTRPSFSNDLDRDGTAS